MVMTREAVWWRRPWNGLLRGTTALGWRGTVLHPEHLLERAGKETGLADFGDMEFLEPLQLLVREFEDNANADPAGRQVFAHILLGSLKNRLRIRKAIGDYPDIARQAIASPLFVVGLPRTGTTLLQGLLANLRCMRTPLRWETDLTPAPPAVAEPRAIKAQIKLAKDQTNYLNALVPAMAAAHEVGALLPEECNPLLMTSFRALLHCAFFPCPRYHDYLYQTRFRHAYEWHRQHLQVLSFGEPPRTWSLKSPVHLASLGELLQIYPDARIVFTHRDPLEAVPSMGALTASLHKILSPAQDKADIGREMMRWLSTMSEAGHAARDRWPASAPPFIDIRYPDLVGDPLGTLRTILRHFALPEDDDLEAKVGQYLHENRQHQQGRHLYSLAVFDLQESAIRTAFQREFDLLK
jgi:hypothetical protein